MIKAIIRYPGIFIPVLLFITACEREPELNDDEKQIFTIDIDTPDWTEETHGNNVSPNYTIVFNESLVQRIDITIDPVNWDIMIKDLNTILGSNNNPQGGQPPARLNRDPVWVSCNLKFNDIKWYKVGVRFKGNSSLKSSWNSGIKKLSFKLDFDEFEDTYPAINNQRFYGFKQLNLKNNFLDKSLMREKIASDLFMNFGLVSPHTAFYRLFVDFGNGPVYFGLYTMVEEVDDTVIEDNYASTNGNLYKPEGKGATFAFGSFNMDDFVKKSNEEEADWSDVKNLYNIINSDLRTTDNETWKNELENIFDVDIFLKWLAANTVMQNWDTYGVMHHNYYLYNNPESSKLEWIPWDNNEALEEGKQGGAISIPLTDVSDQWPLIRFIADQPGYYSVYNQYVSDFTKNCFNPDLMLSLYSGTADLIREYVTGLHGEIKPYTFIKTPDDFDEEVQFLQNHVRQRFEQAEVFIDKRKN